MITVIEEPDYSDSNHRNHVVQSPESLSLKMTNGWTGHDRSGWRTEWMVKGSRSKQQENVLVEEVRHKLKVVAEGHMTLHRNIEDLAAKTGELKNSLDELRMEVRNLAKQMNEGFMQITKLLADFEKQLEHHVH